MSNCMKPEQMMRAYVDAHASTGVGGTTLRISRTLTEAASTITLDEGDDEAPLNGVGGALTLILPTGMAGGGGIQTYLEINATINDIATGYENGIPGAPTTSVTVCFSGDVFAAGVARLSVVGGAFVTVDVNSQYKSIADEGSYPTFGTLAAEIDAITKIVLFPAGEGFTFPAGTIIRYEEIAAS